MTENSQPSAKKKRGRGRPFQKGVSGNPGGRPKGLDEMKELARAHTVEAIERLAYWMRSDNAAVSKTASDSLLDRGWGRATQPLAGEDGKPLLPTIVTQIVER